MGKESSNIIRNILMNEMGLTREVVRQEVTEVVASTARAYLDKLMQSGWLEKIVMSEVNKMLRKPESRWRGDQSEFETLLRSVAESAMRQVVKDHIKISVE